jgi:hypothetical protein
VPSAEAEAQQAAREEAPPVVIQPDLSDPLPDDDVAEALEKAAATGEPVEIASQTTETSISYAQPDGTVTVESTAGPVRTLVDDEWVDVDTSLERTADGVRPAAVTGDIVFSAGGHGPMAVLGDGEGKEIGFDWPGELPEPVLEGDTATYRNVLPDVDLVLIANRLGFQQHLVVNSPPDAATLETLSSIELPLTAEGATVVESETGQLQVVNDAGEVVVSTAAPVMWDARTDARTDEPIAAENLDVELTPASEPGTDATLVVTPPAGYLTDPATEYPVVIDPTQTLGALGDSFVANDFPNQNYGGSTELCPAPGSVEARN